MTIAQLSKKQPVVTKLIEPTFKINASLTEDTRMSSFTSILPFRVKFTHVHIPSQSPNLIPAIPFQIIGYSNYIL